MGIKKIKQNNINWWHIDEKNEEAFNSLRDNFRFHPLDMKDVEGGTEEAKLDVYKNYLFLILHFPVLHREMGQVESVELDIFLGPDYLITIQKGALKSMSEIFEKLQGSANFRQTYFSSTPAHLLYRILDSLYRETQDITKYILKKLRQLEDEVYSEDVNEETTRKIAYLRRKILAMKRIYDPQIEVVHELSQLKTGFMAEEANVYFDDIDDHVNKVSNFLNNQKYALKDLLEVHDSLVTHATNKVIKILTMISVGMLPLTLLSGIYGMNIDLPLSHKPTAVWMFFTFLLIIIVGIMIAMKRKRLL